MKTLGIYFSESDPFGYPFGKKEYLESYQEIVEKLLQDNIKTVFVRGNSYLGAQKFSHGYLMVYKNGKCSFQKKDNIEVDLIFNRDNLNTIPEIHDCPIINHPELDDLCVDKLKTSEMFPSISPKTKVLHSYQEYQDIISECGFAGDDIIVLKKNYETEGNGIYIGKISDFSPDFYSDWSDILFQEFVDSSCGIPGIIEGLHDIRLVSVNGKITTCILRWPQTDTYLANVSQGGGIDILSLDSVPQELIVMVQDLSDRLGKKYGTHLFSADFMNSKDGYKLVELNSRPGLLHPSWTPNYYHFNGAVIDMLKKAIA